MTQIKFAEAAQQAILEEMRRDPRVFVMGQDIRTGAYSAALAEFGPERIRNTPICETGFYGAGIGAALTGMRPVIEGAFSTFLYSAMDQIANQAAKSRYMFGGQASVPIVMRNVVSYATASAAHHSDRPWGLFAQIPGLKTIVPTTSYDVKGLLRSALRDGNPILCLEDVNLVGIQGAVPAGDFTVPIGVAEIKRSGRDLTIVAVANAVHTSLAAAEVLEQEGISAEIVDVRTAAPLDRDTILDSVARTRRLIVVDPAPGMCGVAAEVAAMVAEHCFEALAAPVLRLTAPNVPVPFSPDLERLMYPTVDTVAAAARRIAGRRVAMHSPFPRGVTQRIAEQL